MSEKLELKEKLAAIDLGARSLWDDVNEDERKRIKGEFFILNRYISSVKSNNRDVAEHYVLAVNEYFNKHWYTLQQHPKLLWQLLCCCGYENKQAYFHEWIGNKKKAGEGKKLKLLQEMYPSRKMYELEMLADMMTTKELKHLAQEQCWDDKKIDKFF